MSIPIDAGRDLPGNIDEAGYALERRGVIMHPAADDPNQAWGVLNPAAARDPGGDLWIFPRLVAEHNYSRIGRAKVRFDQAGDPIGTDPSSIVLEPSERWEINARTAGVEDPRITWLAALGQYVMNYTAYGPLGARIGIALSTDLEHWERLGPLCFNYQPGLVTDLNLYGNKDAVWFPEPVTAPDGSSAYAILHRPTWDLSEISLLGYSAPPAGITDPRPGIWVSFADAAHVGDDLGALARVGQHRHVATSERPWELLKIGAGTPPIRTRRGWLTVYHGVTGIYEPGRDLQQRLQYSAGVMVHDPEDITRLVYRSPEALLEPDTPEEQEGIVPNVVFPTGIDDRGNGHADVFYGMADSRIGWARLTYP